MVIYTRNDSYSYNCTTNECGDNFKRAITTYIKFSYNPLNKKKKSIERLSSLYYVLDKFGFYDYFNVEETSENGIIKVMFIFKDNISHRIKVYLFRMLRLYFSYPDIFYITKKINKYYKRNIYSSFIMAHKLYKSKLSYYNEVRNPGGNIVMSSVNLINNKKELFATVVRRNVQCNIFTLNSTDFNKINKGNTNISTKINNISKEFTKNPRLLLNEKLIKRIENLEKIK